MNAPAIRADHLGKQYRIGTARASYETLRDVISSAVSAPVRALRTGVPDGSADGVRRGARIWALRDVSFSIQEGEVVGLIGRNGAGKSTLLKILSRVTEPTVGRVELRGRVGSLLEVGTGFHPELTGRENIYLSGAILGMTRVEIRQRFAEIVEFSGIGRFLDTPVKYYSSGMEARLGFAVAAHLEPDILLVDEVLAVGDAAFQKRCLGKMDDVAREGRTILFVSHNMTAITQLCPRTVLLDAGSIVRDGATSEVVPEYLRTDNEGAAECIWDDPDAAPGSDRVRLRSIRVVSAGLVRSEVDIDKEIAIEVEFWNLKPGLASVCANIYLLDGMGTVILSTANTPGANALRDEWFSTSHPDGLVRATCTLPGNFLNHGLHYVTVYMVSLGPIQVEAEAHQAVTFNVFDTGVMRDPGGGSEWPGAVRLRLPWRTEFLEPLKPTAAVASSTSGRKRGRV